MTLTVSGENASVNMRTFAWQNMQAGREAAAAVVVVEVVVVLVVVVAVEVLEGLVLAKGRHGRTST